jgi:hypothetical protein
VDDSNWGYQALSCSTIAEFDTSSAGERWETVPVTQLWRSLCVVIPEFVADEGL